MSTYTVGGAVLGVPLPPGGFMPGPVPQPFQAATPPRPGIVAGEQPVVDEVQRQQAAARLQHVYRWIEATASVAPQVLDVVPMLVTAVQLYEAQQYAASLNQVQAAAGLLQRVRWAVPVLPPL